MLLRVTLMLFYNTFHYPIIIPVYSPALCLTVSRTPPHPVSFHCSSTPWGHSVFSLVSFWWVTPLYRDLPQDLIGPVSAELRALKPVEHL